MPPQSLKQKLSALSLAQSAPSSPSPTYGRASRGDGGGGNNIDTYANSANNGTMSATAKRRMFLHAPSWMKKPVHQRGADQAYGDEEMRLVQEVLGKMIFQAGVDYETRPIVVMNASALPDPQVVSYDLLLSHILSYLNLYVEADYTVVFFAAGSKYTPSWNWIWKAYRSLSRKFRKNLKQLYIIHSSFFSKMLFSLAGAIISPKFFRKITYISTLSELALHVPITQIDIAPAVYQENLKYEKSITMPTPTRSNVFRVPLEDLMGYNGEKGGVPRVIKDAAQYLRDTGMEDQGLFRRSPSSVMLRAAQDAYDRGNVVSLASFGDPNLAAVLIKKYLRDLPEPIFPESSYPAIRRCPIPAREGDTGAELTTVRYIREVLLPELVPCASILLSYILHLLHDVSLRSEVNLMNASNLSMMITPNLLKGSNPVRDIMMSSVPVPSAGAGMSAGTASSTFAPESNDQQSGGSEGKATLGIVIAFCIRRYYEVFDEVVDRTEAVSPWKTAEGPIGDDDAGEDASGTYVLGEDEDLDDELSDIQRVPHQQGTANAGPSSRTPAVLKRHRQKNSVEIKNPATSSIPASEGPSSPSAWNTRVPPANGLSTNGKAHSVVGVENNNNTVGNTAVVRRGSITFGKAATRKGSGSAVEAVGVTAAGFFTPPKGVSPPAQSYSTITSSSSSQTAEPEEDGVLNVVERRKVFESSGGGPV